MEFRYTDELSAYMRKKGHTSILLSVFTPHTWTGCPELVSSFTSPRLTESLRARGIQEVPTSMGSVFIGSSRLEFDDVVTLGLYRFLGIGDLKVEGVHLRR